MKHLLSLSISISSVLVLSGLQGCGSDTKTPKNTSDASTGGGGGGGTGGTGGTGGSSAGGGGGTGGVPLDAWSPEPTGSACVTAADCYPTFDGGTLSGPIECIDKVTNGYCTHQCNTDSDCCAVVGECRTTLKQVCAPFENTGYKVCFLSCETADLVPPADASSVLPDGAPVVVDPTEYCQREANPQFACRSTGGGSQNRMVCMPALAADGGPRPDGAPGTGGAPPTDGAIRDGTADGKGG